MSQHTIVGAGAIGGALALLLADRGERVTVVTRSGGGPEHPGVDRVRADAADPDALVPHVEGAVALYSCANPGTYQQWEREWPPLAAALLRAAERTGAVLVTLSNLYGYGPVLGPIGTDLPLAATGHKGRLRARMWSDALAAHEAGRLRATEVRAADYIGPTVGPAAGLLRRYANAAYAGKTVWSLGDPDVAHSFSYVPDVAALLATVASDERAWGRAWHVPGADPRSVRQVLTDLLAVDLPAETGPDATPAPSGAGPAPRIRRVPRALLTAAAPVVPIVRELGEVLWQLERPFVIDAGPTTAAFGLTGTPWPEVRTATARGWARPA
ncbi:MAG TPA: NAD-dependent epimerase/dehydratase family protein [Cellulomonas sp.]